MNQKQIGTVLILLGILLTSFVYFTQARQKAAVDVIAREQGTCFLPDGTCLHEQAFSSFIPGWAISAAVLALGVYLIFFDRTQKVLAEHQLKVSSALREAKEKENQKDEFQAFLSAFSGDEQKVLKAVNEQEGILQSTLRYRTGMSKTRLSLMLKSFEERGIISRKNAGKTNKVFLRKKF